LPCLNPRSFQITTNIQQTKIADLVQIEPDDFKKGDLQCIEDNINAKYANKVIQNIGLCICLYDLIKASDGLIGNGTGLVNINGPLSPTFL
jgi:DNA-directed RNA polymerase III subunit RPC8